MKVLLLNGSSNLKGCTYTALEEIAKTLQEEGIDTEIFQIGAEPLRDCIGCGGCSKGNGWGFRDDCVNEFVEKARDADGFVFATPVYFAHPSGRIFSFLDRAFYSGSAAFAYKPGAAVASCRRAGTTATLDQLNKYFTINCMPVVSSQYWNMVHGNTPEEVVQDKEGLQIMRTLGNNMAWLLHCIQAGKEQGIALPEREPKEKTNFIR